MPAGKPSRRLAAVLGAWAALSLAVNLPPHVWALFTGWHLALALEVGAAFALIALWRGRRGRRRARASVPSHYEAFSRESPLSLEMHMLESVVRG